MPHVLIADDEPLQRILLRETLNSNASLILIEAGSGPEALELAFANPPDLIILDVMMPDMTGTQVCRILKAEPQFHHIPVILISASRDNQEAALNAGADAFISRPFEADDLEAAVQKALTAFTR